MPLILPKGSIYDEVYNGFWINQSLGSQRGATLTLDRQAGGIIIAFLALFIAAAARSLWKITRFMMHVYATEPASINQDGIYHQRQAILRNQSIALNAVLDLSQLGYVWRHRAREGPQRVLPVILVASIISSASIAAGILSSKFLTDSNNEVLIAGRHCGVYVSDENFPDSNMEPLMLYLSQKAIDAFTYATQCYSEDDAVRSELCETFIRSTVPFTANRNASCPFSGNICKSDFGNILLESGELHSRVHLGFNQDPQFTLRYKTHCAPLKTVGYTDLLTAGNSSQSRQVYRYGRSRNQNYVFAVDVKDKVSSFDASTFGNYKITVVTDGDLIPELKRPNGSVSLSFLDSSEIVYGMKTEDPWFSATTSYQGTGFLNTSEEDRGLFVADEPASVLGCATERFYCNPKLPESEGCIDAFTVADNQSSSTSFNRAWPNEDDESVMRALVNSLSPRGLETYYTLPNSPALLSRGTVTSGVQTATLPKDRWKEEREYLYKASLASVQYSMIDHARGFSFGQDPDCFDKPYCRRICHSQKIRSSRHYSFNAWILGTILFIGSTLMLVSTFLEELVTLLLRYPLFRSAKIVYSHAEWQAGSTLQLQRLAHENLGLGTWSRTDEEIPVTEPGDTLGVLDITNEKHARMVAPTQELDRLRSTENQAISTGPTLRYFKLPSTENL